MITTNDDNISETCRLSRSHGQISKYNHMILGYNYRMTDIQVAIGIIQLNKLDKFNEKRIQNTEYLNNHIKLDGITLPYKDKKVKHIYQQYAIKIDENISRENLMKYLISNKIGCAIHYPTQIYKQPLYQNLRINGNCPVAEELCNKVLSLPVHPLLDKEDLKYIVEVIDNYENPKINNE